MNELNFKINGFHCESCVKVSTMKIKKISGVESVAIEPDGRAKVVSTVALTLDDITKSLDGLGYTVAAA
jgi:copper chaperone CopZ